MAGALPKAVKAAGHEIRVVTPCYQSIKERKYGLREVSRLKTMGVSFGGITYSTDVKSGFIPGSKVQTYFLHNAFFFDRDGLYIDPTTDKDYPDNHLRFAFLCHATLQLMATLQWTPDIIHCNDWQTGLMPYLLKKIPFYSEHFGHIRTVMHLHNAGYQGLFSLDSAEELGLDPADTITEKSLEFYHQLSFLKAGVACADMLATVSPSYAQEIQENAEYGCGLEGLYRYRNDSLVGILNGVDMSIWNPTNDRHIPCNYSYQNVTEGKAVCKALLQERLGLTINPDIPIISMVTRFAYQKGLGLLDTASDSLLNLPVQFVCLGAASTRDEEVYQDMWSKWHNDHPDKVGVQFGHDEVLAHLIEAGSDMLLMPSRYEPCGLNQMYSLLYGTIPIVRKTGGLADTVKDFNPADRTGNGFTFDKFDAESMFAAILRAIEVYHDKETWLALQQTGMQSNFSWAKSAARFVELYKSLRDSARCRMISDATPNGTNS